ncbi:MAG: phosphoribosylformylglycinamidine synthase subunit PurS [Ignavibacteria bacterium]|nr:phosphoribosylformylglycinamidine synthase subunit PurS [Ignavibacteria bacterium]
MLQVFLAKVHVTLRKSILDPQGKAVEHAVATLGVVGVDEVRIGKYIEFRVDGKSEQEAREAAEQVCRKLLANPVMEDFSLVVEPQ